MSGSPSVSLIIAVYNQPVFLRRIFLSLLNQTFNDFEIVVADDGSGAEIKKAIADFSGKFHRPIKHIWHEDHGFRKTIIANRAVAAAQAEYLVFIDGDCLLHHRFVERHFKRRALDTVLSGRRVSFDEILSSRIAATDICSCRFEKMSFWLGHCPLREIKHGLFLPAAYRIDALVRTTWPILGSNFSLFKNDFCSVNGYDERIIGRGMEDSNLYERLRVKRLRFRNLSREAIQYHLFHRSNPIPHTAETIREFCFPKSFWTEFGMVKGPQPPSA
jgi:glycosyltransferase involved in cell wall biosynthesis